MKKELENKNMLLNNKIIELNNQLSYKNFQMVDIQKKIDSLNNTNEKLENNNNILSIKNNELENEINDFSDEFGKLKSLILQKEKESIYTKKINDKNIQKLKNDINSFKEIIDNKVKENKELENKFNKIKEEKNKLINKINCIDEENEILHNSGDKKNFKKSYEKDKYILEKNEEIKSLNKYISKIKKEYYEAIEKKKFYKNQCRLFNEQIDIIKNNLNPDQIQKIQQELIKKGIDLKEKKN